MDLVFCGNSALVIPIRTYTAFGKRCCTWKSCFRYNIIFCSHTEYMCTVEQQPTSALAIMRIIKISKLIETRSIVLFVAHSRNHYYSCSADTSPRSPFIRPFLTLITYLFLPLLEQIPQKILLDCESVLDCNETLIIEQVALIHIFIIEHGYQQQQPQQSKATRSKENSN